MATEIVRDYFSDYARNSEFGMSRFMRNYDHGLPREIERASAKNRMNPLEYMLTLVDDQTLVQRALNTLYTDPNYLNLYQQLGAKSILDKKRFLIADGVGTGKTLQAVIAKKELDKKRGHKTRTLVVCPNQMKYEWQARVWEYCPGTEDVVIINGYDERVLESAGDADFLVVNYEAFGSKNGNLLTQKLLEMGFDFVVLDEVHRVKNPAAKRSEDRVKKIADSTEYLAMLSGTPIPNDINDAYMLISAMDPSAYPTAEHVRRAHQNNPNVIGALLRSHMMRWTQKEVFDFPWRINLDDRTIDLDAEHREIYDAILNYEMIEGGEKLDLLRKALLDPSLLSSDVKQSEEIQKKVRRIFRNSPELLENFPESSKYRALDEIIEEAVAKGEKTVVFTSLFREGVTRKLEERYAKYGALRIDGDVTSGRENIRSEFQTNPDCKVLIATTRTTGEGISLTAAKNVVFIDEPYTSTEREQAIGRAYRRGQKGDVNVITLIGRDTVDEGVRELLETKQKGIEKLVDGAPYDEFKKYLDALSKGTIEQGPIKSRMYTPQQTNRQKLIRHFSAMQGKNWEQIQKYVDKYGNDIAELYADLWEGSLSENAAKVYRQIIEAIEEKEGKLARKADIGSGPAILSRVTGEPIINVDINPANFKKAAQTTHPDNDYLQGILTNLPVGDGVIDLALCSLALHYTKLDENTKEREKTLREANRILRKNGYYITVLPYQVITGREDEFLQGLNWLGFDIIPELTGHVKATEPEDSDFRIYVATAKKAGEPSNDDVIIPFNSDFSRVGKGRRSRTLAIPQQGVEVCERFAFYDPETGTEDVEKRLRRYLSRDAANEIKRQVGELPTATLYDKEYAVRPGRRITTYVPKENIERLLEQLRINHDGISKRELREKDPALYNELKRLSLLHLVE